MRRTVLIIAVLTTSAMTVCLAYFGWIVFMIGYGLAHGNDCVTDLARYPMLLAEARDAGMASQFPDEIDHTALSVFYSPGFLQAARILQLRVAATEEDMRRITAAVPNEVRTSGPDGTSLDSRYGPQLYSCSPASDEGEAQPLPKTYELWNYRGHASSEYQGRPSWNHGEIEGVAIDRTRGEVLYFAELW